jgi:hypothetical protein
MITFMLLDAADTPNPPLWWRDQEANILRTGEAAVEGFEDYLPAT